MKRGTISVITLALTLGIFTACEEIKDKEKEIEAILDMAGALDKEFKSTCITASDVTSGGNRVKLSLKINTNNTFTYLETWYTGSCSPVNYTVIYQATGTFSLAELSNTAKTINFVITAGDISPHTTAAQTAINSDCGGTSPYNSGVNASYNGGHNSTFGGLLCQNRTFPNSSQKNVQNIITYDGSKLRIGTPDDSMPGVFTGQTVPATADIEMSL